MPNPTQPYPTLSYPTLSGVGRIVNPTLSYTTLSGVGRIVRAVREEGGSLRTVHVGNRMALEHAKLVKAAVIHSQVIRRLDVAGEWPIDEAVGMEVYSRPTGQHPGFGVKWYETFDGENKMFAWRRGE